MRIAIISDVHLGHGAGTERQEDPFEGLREALEKSLGCDFILVAGDLFDSRTPSTETLARAMEMLILPMVSEDGARLARGIGKQVEDLTPLHQQGIPVVAIHGTHERRVRGLINPLEALEKAGFLIHLHVNGVALEKDGERVCVQGMSGVPEHFSEPVLKRWSPRPRKACFNILMLHQSVSPFMYAEHLLPAESLPRGFDLYVLGHIHESRKAEHAGSPLLIPGSLVPTQLTKDSASPRGFWIFDTGTGDAAFITLDSQRRVYHLDHGGTQEELEEEVEKLLSHEHGKKPIIRVRAREAGDHQRLAARFQDRALLSVAKEAREEAPPAKGMEEQALSVRETGAKLLSQNLADAGLDPDTFSSVFDLLEHGKQDEALRLLSPVRDDK